MSIYESIVYDLDYEKDLSLYSSLALAYIGDSVYENLIRTLAVSSGNQKVEKLHKRVSKISQASTQAYFADLIFDNLNDEEVSVFKRGRNASKHSHAKHQTIADYKKSTGFEALVGWLYLQGDDKRILQLLKLPILEKLKEND